MTRSLARATGALLILVPLAALAACADLLGLEDKTLEPAAEEAGVDAAIKDGSTVATPDGTATPDANDGGPVVTLETIAMMQDHPYGIVVDGAYAFWANEGSATFGGEIVRQNKAVSSPVVSLATGISHPEPLIGDALYLYFTSNNEPPALDGGPDASDDDGGKPVLLGRVAKDSKNDAGTSDVTPFDVGNADSLWRGITLFDAPPADGSTGTDAFIYTAEDAEIDRWARDGSGSVDIADTLGGVVALAVDDTMLYFATKSDRTISVVAKDGSTTPAPLVTDEVTDLAIDDVNVYWVNPNGVLYRFPKDGSKTKEAVAAGGSAAAAKIIVDNANVYWFRSDPDAPTDGEVLMAPKNATDATPISIARSVNDPRGIAVDHDPISGKPIIYFTAHGDGTVHRATVH